MSDKEYNSTYFDDALRIHAICADKNICENDARLLTYMHAKGCESGKGVDYFYNPADEDSEALEIMLGKSKGSLRIPSVMSLDEKGQEALELVMTISDKINKLDNLLAKECGLENRLSGELKTRLRLYKEPEFRDKMVKLYKTEIVDDMPQYTKDKIDLAFLKFREEQQKIEQEILDMVGFKKE